LNLKFFEFGKTYIQNEKIVETPQLAIAVTGFDAPESWMRQQNKTNFYFIKGLVENLLAVCGFTKLLELEINQQPFSTGISFSVGNKVIAVAGIIDPKLQQVFDIKQPIFYAEVYTELVLKLMS